MPDIHMKCFNSLQSLSSSAVQGVIIGLCLAFPILVIATSNIIVGLMATVTICLITVSVIGVIPLAGWKLGVGDTILLHLYNQVCGC